MYVLIVGFCLALTTIYLNKTLKESSVAYLSMMSMTVPVINSTLGLVFLKESVSIYQLVGGAMILGSIIMIQKLKI
jgi:drug/metabolite transporter (DMT)-like permease